MLFLTYIWLADICVQEDTESFQICTINLKRTFKVFHFQNYQENGHLRGFNNVCSVGVSLNEISVLPSCPQFLLFAG